MTEQTRRRFSPEFKEQSLLGCRSRVRRMAVWLPSSASHQRSCRLELEAAGSAAATAAQKAEAAELVQLRRDNFADAVRQMPCRFLRGTHLAVKILLIIMDQQ